MTLKPLCSEALALLFILSTAGHPSDTVKKGQPTLGYHLAQSFPVGATARLVAHADLNGDGKEDLVLAGETPRMRERAVEILEGNGDGTFREGVTITLQNPTRAIVIADVNGDGKPDLILLHPGVAVLLNTTPSPGAPASFAKERAVVGGFGPALAAADLNHDGKAEVLLGTTPTRDATDNGSIRIATFESFGKNPQGVAEIPVPGVPTSIAVSDLDGDGKPELVVAFRAPVSDDRNRPGGVAVFMNRTEDGSATFRFADPILIRFDHPIDFVAAADLNGDRRIDVFGAWCGDGKAPCGAVSLLNTTAPAGIEFRSQSSSLSVTRASNWFLEDINHDGKPDLMFLSQQQAGAFPNAASGEIVVAFGLGNGGFARLRTFPAPTSDSLSMALADFNRDGFADVVVVDASPTEGRIRILLGQRDSGFGAPESLDLGFIPTSVIPFSTHEKADGFVVTNLPQVSLGSSSRAGHTAKVFSPRSLVAPYPPIATITGLPDGAIAVGDLKNDSRIEMVAVTASSIQIYSLGGKTQHHPAQTVKLQPVPNRFLAAPQRAILEDLNGDGKPDLIVGNGYDRSLQIYINTSSDTFSFAAPVAVSWCPKGFPPLLIKVLVNLSIDVASADMNGDGKADLVVNGQCGLNVILNRTSGAGTVTFDQPFAVSDPSQPGPRQFGSFVLADLNRDGKMDVLTIENSYTNGGEVSALDVFINDTTSSPTFHLAQHVQVSKRIVSLASGDLNGDRWPDVAVVDPDGTLTFLLNDGQWKSKGGLSVHSSFVVMPSPQQVLIVDRPQGGLPALVLRNNGSAAIVQ